MNISKKSYTLIQFEGIDDQHIDTTKRKFRHRNPRTGRHCPSLGLYCTVLIRPRCVPSKLVSTVAPNEDLPAKCLPSKLNGAPWDDSKVNRQPSPGQTGEKGSFPVRATIFVERSSKTFSCHNFTKWVKWKRQCCGFLRLPSGAYLKQVFLCSCRCPDNAQTSCRSSQNDWTNRD